MKKASRFLMFATTLFCGHILLSSCNKTDTPAQKRCDTVTTPASAAEVVALQAYLTSKGITAVADRRGFFYTITKPGSDVHPTICSVIRVSYTGRLTDGNEFDASGGASFSLGNLIPGWQEGIPLIGKGGSITLYLPPSLGYGSQASGKIPANSILVFGIDLMDVQ